MESSIEQTLRMAEKYFRERKNGPTNYDWDPKTDKLGEGAYGAVYRVKDKQGNVFAMKKYKDHGDNDGVDPTTIRELCIARQMRNDNIVSLYEVEKVGKDVFGIYEYVEMDLHKFLRQNKTLSLSTVRQIMYDILSGIAYIHNRDVMHRDLKPQNILYDKGVTKIADLGAGRYEEKNVNYTSIIVTLWYRAPEILLGEQQYNEKIDMWSIGCILLEMFKGEPIFRGADSQIGMLFEIFQLLGVPKEEALTKLRYFKLENYPEWQDSKLDEFFNSFSINDPNVQKLARGLLEFDPAKRISALEALENPFFDSIRKPINTLPREQLMYQLSYRYQIKNYTTITSNQRFILFEWLTQVALAFRLKTDTLLHAMTLVDSFFSNTKEIVEKKNIQLIGITALFIAAKLLETVTPDIVDYVNITAKYYRRDEIIYMEEKMLNHFKYLIPPILPVDYMKRLGVSSPRTVYLLVQNYASELGLKYSLVNLMFAVLFVTGEHKEDVDETLLRLVSETKRGLDVDTFDSKFLL